MPSAFTHLFVSGVFGKTYSAERMPMRFWVLAAFCSVLPDIDIIGFYFGIRYNDMLGHRGFAHSLTFALLVSILVVVLAFPHLSRFSKKWWGMLAFFFFVTASHGLLDSMTDKGMGVGFFIPFDNARYFMPWRPIFASPMKISRFFSRTGLEVLFEEIIWIWVPVMLFYAGVSMFRRYKKAPPAARP
jgi:inner membrane protein